MSHLGKVPTDHPRRIHAGVAKPQGVAVAKHISTGLDIATSCVRAAQLGVKNGEFRLERFGQVPLPVGAVSDGEVQAFGPRNEVLEHMREAARINASPDQEDAPKEGQKEAAGDASGKPSHLRASESTR